MNNFGWVKLHRRILDNPIHLKGEWFSIWIHLLLLASHDDHSFIWNGQSQVIKSGQLLTGRKELAKQCGVSESMVERVLKYLEIEHQIEQQKTTKYRVITILNWDKYQTKDTKSDNKRTTDEQQADTYKNDNKVKKVKEYISILEGQTPAEEAREFFERGSKYEELLSLASKDKDGAAVKKEFEKFVLYWTEPNGTGTKERWEQQPTFDVKRRLLTWLGKINSFGVTKKETNIL